jgi:hypothetical protein
MIKQHLNSRRVSSSFFFTLVCLAFAFNSPLTHSAPATDALEVTESQHEMLEQSNMDQGHQHEHRQAAYVCPMHPDEVSDKPGKCSQCGMFLVAQEMGGSEIDHSTHNHAAPTTKGMQHEKMTMPREGKPALFWENTESQTSSKTEHRHSESSQHDHSMPKRMTPAPPR